MSPINQEKFSRKIQCGNFEKKKNLYQIFWIFGVRFIREILLYVKIVKKMSKIASLHLYERGILVQVRVGIAFPGKNMELKLTSETFSDIYLDFEFLDLKTHICPQN